MLHGRRRRAGAAVLGAAGMLALAGCGGSSSTSETASTTVVSSGSTSTVTIVPGQGSPFCATAATALAQLGHLNALVPGGGSSLAGIKQLMAEDVRTVDGLESSAPPEIAADFHALRVAFDQANTNVQAATSIQQLSSAFLPLESPAVTTANGHISRYAQSVCAVGTSAATTT